MQSFANSCSFTSSIEVPSFTTSAALSLDARAKRKSYDGFLLRLRRNRCV